MTRIAPTIFILALSAMTAYADDLKPFRVIGTNLLDFTPVIRHYGDHDSPYSLFGKVVAVSDSGAIFAVTTVRVRYHYQETTQDLLRGGPGDLLKSLAASQISRRSPDGVPLATLLALSPETRARFTPVTSTNHIRYLVTNATFALGQSGYFYAWPLPQTRPCKLPDGTTKELPCYDYGIPYQGSITNFPFFFSVTPTNVVKLFPKRRRS